MLPVNLWGLGLAGPCPAEHFPAYPFALQSSCIFLGCHPWCSTAFSAIALLGSKLVSNCTLQHDLFCWCVLNQCYKCVMKWRWVLVWSKCNDKITRKYCYFFFFFSYSFKLHTFFSTLSSAFPSS